MPPLPISDPPIASALASPPARPLHPSPAISLRGAEQLSGKEAGWWDHRFGLDTAYFAVPLGFGEWAPLYGQDALEGSPDVVVLAVPRQFAPEGGGGQ